MRVIAGRFKGRSLTPVKGGNVRHTSDRVRGSLFSILGYRVEGCSFLDLFAGAGTVGIEAMSRGADFVMFVERSRRCVRALVENLRACGVDPKGESVKILEMDALRALSVIEGMGLKFDIIFIDPPYGSPLLEKTLTKLAGMDLIREGGMVIAEHPFRQPPPDRIDPLRAFRRERYGDTGLTFYTPQKTEGENEAGSTGGIDTGEGSEGEA